MYFSVTSLFINSEVWLYRIALFTVYNSMSFDTCNMCIKPLPQSRYRNFWHSSKFHTPLEISPSLIPSLQITNNLSCHSRLTCFFSMILIKWNDTLYSWFWFLSLSFMRFILCTSVVWVFLLLNNIHYMDLAPFVYPFNCWRTIVIKLGNCIVSSSGLL